MKGLYIGALIAFKGTRYQMITGAVIASNHDEAFGYLFRLCRETCPPGDGWTNHAVASGKITDETIDELIAERGRNNSP